MDFKAAKAHEQQFFKRNQFEEGLQFFGQLAKQDFNPDPLATGWLKRVFYRNQECRFMATLGYQSMSYQHGQHLLLDPFYRGLLDRHPDLVGDIHINLGESSFYQGEYEQCIRHCDQAIKAIERVATLLILADREYSLIRAYLILGKGYWQKGDYYRALQNYLKSLVSCWQYYDREHYLVGRLYTLIGGVYLDLRQYQLAHQLLEEALRVLRKALPVNNHWYIGVAELELGRCLAKGVNAFVGKVSRKELIAGAEQHYERAQIIFDNQNESQQPNRYSADLLGLRALLAAKRKPVKPSEVKPLFSAAIQEWKKVFEDRPHPKIAWAYNHWGSYYLDQAERRSSDDLPLATLVNHALRMVADAKAANRVALLEKYENKPALEQSLTGALSKTALLASLKNESKALLVRYLYLDGKPEDLEQARIILEVAMDLVDRVKVQLPFMESKMEMSRLARPIHEMAMRVLYETRQASSGKKKDQLADEILHLLQRSKVVSLIESVQNPGRFHFDRIVGEGLNPDPENINVLNRIVNLILKKNGDSASLNGMLNEERKRKWLLEINSFFEGLNEKLKREEQIQNRKLFPPFTANALKKAIDKDGPGLIVSYFLGDQHLFKILVSRKEFKFEMIYGREQILRLIKMAEDFPKKIDGLRAYRKDDSESRSLKIQYYLSANTLYEALVAPLSTALEGYQRLYIIPDESLWNIPFEALITRRKPEDLSKPFPAYDYLLNQYEIGYHASVALLMATYGGKPNFTKEHPRYLGIAASIRDVNGQKREDAQSMEREIFATKEIFEKNNLPAKVIYGKDLEAMTIEQLLKCIKGADIVHISGHGNAGEGAKTGSKIILVRRGNQEKLVLRERDLLNQNLDTELVILSSCYAGLGIPVPGEGVFAMNRAFLQEGARNIIYTLLQINGDDANNLIPGFFERVLQPGQPLSFGAALNQMKRNLCKSPDYSPSNWASMVFLGNHLTTVPGKRR